MPTEPTEETEPETQDDEDAWFDAETRRWEESTDR